MLRSLIGLKEEKVLGASPEARKEERDKRKEELLQRQHDLARRVHILEWQTPRAETDSENHE
jgi:hypothetical protein